MNTAYKWLPVTSDACTGCGNCVKTCPHECLELVWDFAKLLHADACVSEGECVEVCAEQGIRMEWVESTGDRNVGRWCETPEPVASQPKGWLQRVLRLRCG